ncbi:MAG TPA: leucyl aminopeptidase family protein [Gammaproteobacteria bacterium]|nr:leucyl aminopeptidase family protein [Gammaproteobacteria bacterium]
MIDLPDFCPLKITQTTEKAGSKAIDGLDHLIVVVPKNAGRSVLRSLPKSTHLERLLRKAIKASDPFVTTRVDNRRATAITVTPFDAGAGFEALTWARKLFAESGRLKASRIGVTVAGIEGEARDAVLEPLIRAADAAAFEMPSFKSKPSNATARPRSLKLLAMTPRVSIESLRRGGLGNNIARWLTALPPNKLTTASYRATAQSLAKRHSMKYEFIDTAGLRRLGAGAFLAVAQGNAADDAGIIHLSYRPTRSARPVLALVGKGILFDTGGTNLKPFKGMLDMHMDMQGSAVALGTAVELAARSVPFGFDVWLAVTENRISATAYKSQDVVVAMNGVSIQVIHTDAEGRMVLADTLSLAAEAKPDLIIDYATLTGACVGALTTRYSGVFSNRAGSARSLLGAGMSSGERVWPFPLDDDFDDALKSDVADIKQCAVEGSGDHIYAARFLKRFVPDDIAWVHLDLSAGQHKGGLGAIPSEFTGFGVAFTLELLADNDPSALAAGWS